jgi:hypothetical protein
VAPRGRLTFALPAAGVALTTAAIALWGNRDLSSDLYFLLAGGRYVVEHGFPYHEVFPTLNAGGAWYFAQWLTAVVFYAVYQVAGIAGVEVFYALVLGAALVPLVVGCRDRRPREVAAAWLLLLPTLIAVLDPRAAGFSLLAFSLTVVLVTGERRTWRVWLIPPLFLVWANLHAAWAAGLLLVALAAIGGAIDERRLGRTGSRLTSRRFAALGLAAPAVLATPLGHHVFAYMGVLATDRILPVISFEWQPTIWHPALVAYVAAVAVFGGWIWWRQPGPRPVEPLVVLIGFCALAMTSARQLVWLGPVVFYVLRQAGGIGSIAINRRVAQAVVGAATLAIGAWIALDAPRPAEAQVLTPLGDYAALHPPSSGRIVGTTGMGSYLMWRAPSIPIAIDGRLENYSADTIDRAYGILGGDRSAMSLLQAWDVGGVITSDPSAVAPLEAEGFRLERASDGGFYLVRRGR